MQQKVKEFLIKQHVAVVSIVDLEGFPYSATLHFAIKDNPLTFYFFTKKDSHKVQTLLQGEIANASVVIGFSEEEWLTMQMTGNIHLGILPDEIKDAETYFYTKFPRAERGKEIIPVIFKPLFWKYTDYNREPWEIITSEE